MTAKCLNGGGIIDVTLVSNFVIITFIFGVSLALVILQD